MFTKCKFGIMVVALNISVIALTGGPANASGDSKPNISVTEINTKDPVLLEYIASVAKAVDTCVRATESESTINVATLQMDGWSKGTMAGAAEDAYPQIYIKEKSGSVIILTEYGNEKKKMCSVTAQNNNAVVLLDIAISTAKQYNTQLALSGDDLAIVLSDNKFIKIQWPGHDKKPKIVLSVAVLN